MSLLQAYRAYHALSPEQQEFVQTKKVEGVRSVRDWLNFFQPVDAYDRHTDAVRKTATRAAWITGVLAFLLLFVVGPFAFVLALVPGLLVFTAVTARKRGLADNLRHFVIPTLGLLQEDVHPDEPLTLRLDLSESVHPSKSIPRPPGATPPTVSSGRYPKIKEQFFEAPWMEAEVELVDGAVLRWQITDRVRKRVITKRNARGKIKTKKKFKLKRVVDVRLRAPRKTYALEDHDSEPDRVDVAVKTRPKRNVVKARRVLVSKWPRQVRSLTDARKKGARVPNEGRMNSGHFEDLVLEPGIVLGVVAQAYGKLTPTKERLS